MPTIKGVTVQVLSLYWQPVNIIQVWMQSKSSRSSLQKLLHIKKQRRNDSKPDLEDPRAWFHSAKSKSSTLPYGKRYDKPILTLGNTRQNLMTEAKRVTRDLLTAQYIK